MLKAEKELAIQSNVTIAALNKKLYDLEKETASIIEKEMLDITTQRKKARDERRKRDSEFKDLKADNPEERGAVGMTS